MTGSRHDPCWRETVIPILGHLIATPDQSLPLHTPRYIASRMADISRWLHVSTGKGSLSVHQ